VLYHYSHVIRVYFKHICWGKLIFSCCFPYLKSSGLWKNSKKYFSLNKCACRALEKLVQFAILTFKIATDSKHILFEHGCFDIIRSGTSRARTPVLWSSAAPDEYACWCEAVHCTGFSGLLWCVQHCYWRHITTPPLTGYLRDQVNSQFQLQHRPLLPRISKCDIITRRPRLAVSRKWLRIMIRVHCFNHITSFYAAYV